MLLGRICRTCLQKSPGMRKLRESVKNIKIEDMLNQSIPNFDLDMDDVPLPVEICQDCLGKLEVAFEFVTMCAKSNKELRNILNQQEQEIEGTLMESLAEVNPMDISDENDMLMNNFKKELPDDDSNDNKDNLEEDHKPEMVKLEIELQEAGHLEEAEEEDGNSSSDEYWPNDDKEDSESNFFENMGKKSSPDTKPKRKYNRKAPLKRTSVNTCLHCQKVFSKKTLLTKHLSVHDPDNEFVCDICGYRFSSERKLKTHINGKHNEVELSLSGGPYPCPDCPMIFQQKRTLAAHRVVHAERDIKCQVCDMDLKTVAALTRHMNCKHPDVLPFKCNLCEKAFPVQNQLNDHINEHMGYKKHKCDLCEKSFPNMSGLKDHVRVHTGESPFLCAHCGNCFKTANVLRQHLQRHGEKKFHCNECPMKFYFKENLNKHMTTHTKLKPHVCDICGSAFTRLYSLKAHKFKHSGERPFKCEECNMSFVFKRHLKRHNLTHTGEKPHMCTFCDRAYAASGDLVKHLRTHVGEKTYFCDQCPEAFKYSVDLKDHKILHYKQKLKSQQEQQQQQQQQGEQQQPLPLETKTEVLEDETVIMETDNAVVTLETLYEVVKDDDE